MSNHLTDPAALLVKAAEFAATSESPEFTCNVLAVMAAVAPEFKSLFLGMVATFAAAANGLTLTDLIAREQVAR